MNTGRREAASEASAQERLNQSREHMSRWLVKQGAGAGAKANPEQAQRLGARTGLRGLVANPVALICVDLLRQWWNQHPLLKSARHAEHTAHDAIAPLVRRHPVAVLGSAAAAGALLVWWRPWRWLPGPAKLAGMASNIALGAISTMAIQRKEDPPSDAAL